MPLAVVACAAGAAAMHVGAATRSTTLLISGAPYERPHLLAEGSEAARLLELLAAAPIAPHSLVTRLSTRRELELAVLDTPNAPSLRGLHPDDGRAFGLLYPRAGTAPSLAVLPGADRRPRIVSSQVDVMLRRHGLDLDRPGSRCPVTVRRATTAFNVGLARLRVALYWRRGVLTAGPLADGGVFATVSSGGAIHAKVGWWRARGQLTVSGRRLDRTAPPLRVTVPDGYGSRGFQPSGLEFPTPGCWRVTGRAGGAQLSFVVWVARTT